tara:strand:- start:1164 stop:2213 length:1050 start_codon:yes stop_codon:yes gene_type:complete
MAVQTVEQVKRLPPYLEGLQKRLLQSLFGQFDGATQTTPGLLDKPIDLPDFKLAGLDPLQQMAFSYAPQMFGSYAPFIQSASDQIGQGLGSVGSASEALGTALTPLGAAGTAISKGIGALDDPSAGVKKFFDPYEDAVVRQAERDIDRDYDDRRKKLISGFRGKGQGRGGSGRSAVLEAELAKNRADQKARTTSGLRSSGFQNAMKNFLGGTELSGRLGGQLGEVGTRFGDIGAKFGGLGDVYNRFAGTTGDLGRLTSELGRADLGSLSSLGAMGRTYQQQMLDAYRQNQMQNIMEPYTRLQLGSSFLSGMPSSDVASTFQSTVTPATNPFLAGIGAYTALQGVAPYGQ